MEDNKKQIEEKFKRLWQEEPNKFAIITCLGWYGSTNLKNISMLIGKPETTTLRYIKQLIDEGLIEVDAEKTAAKWGKYYKLVKEVEELYRRSLEEYTKEESEVDKRIKRLKEMTEEEVIEEVLQKLSGEKESDTIKSQAFKDYLSFIHNIENSITNKWIDFEKEVRKKKSKKQKEWASNPLFKTETALIVRTIEVTKLSQVIKIIEVVREFVKKLTELKEEFSREIEKEKITEEKKAIQFISIFLGGLSKME